MVERSIHLDAVFHSLSDPIRRDMLRRVAQQELSVGELAEKYDVSFAAISKHLSVLEKAKLIHKRKEGKKHIITLPPEALEEAGEHLEQYRRLWESRYNKLEALLK